ncbi:MAG: ROK family protein [Deltaproteobacteria bacterium]|nr:MAG: ROK family protein [Deltaproteobacteria bacterium]
MTEAAALAVDLGGTHLRVARVSPEGRILEVRREAHRDRSFEAVVGRIEARLMELSESGPVSAVGVAVAAQILLPEGRVAVAPNLGWRDVPLGTRLSERLPWPVKVMNDLSAYVCGERLAGAGRGCDDLFLLAVGSGVGSGILCGGRLLEGADGLAGEIGHVKVVPGGRLCGCGEHGCLEAYAGGHALAAIAGERIEAGAAGSAIREAAGDGPIEARHIAAAAEAGDPLAQEILQEAAGYLGLAASWMVTVFNPRRLILGGGVLLGSPWLRARVSSRTLELAARPAGSRVAIHAALLGDDAGLIGAAAVAAGP